MLLLGGYLLSWLARIRYFPAGQYFSILPYTFFPTKTLKSQEGIQIHVLPEYIEALLSLATYVVLEDGACYALVPGLFGMIVRGNNLKECRKRLIEEIEAWIASRLKEERSVPSVGRCNLERSFGPDIIR